MKKTISNRAKKFMIAGAVCLALGTLLHWSGSRLEQSIHTERADAGNLISHADEYAGKVVVFFWYGCPHCYRLESELRSSKFDTAMSDFGYDVIRIPAPLNSSWERHARLFYALENAGATHTDHFRIMGAIQKDMGYSDEHLSTLLINLISEPTESNSILTETLSVHNIIQDMNAHHVDEKINESKNLLRLKRIQGVPQLMIDGNEMIKLGGRISYADVHRIAEELISVESDNE